MGFYPPQIDIFLTLMKIFCVDWPFIFNPISVCHSAQSDGWSLLFILSAVEGLCPWGFSLYIESFVWPLWAADRTSKSACLVVCPLQTVAEQQRFETGGWCLLVKEERWFSYNIKMVGHSELNGFSSYLSALGFSDLISPNFSDPRMIQRYPTIYCLEFLEQV